MISYFIASTIGAAVGVTAVLLAWMWQAQRGARIPWRTVFAVLPLPMLALAASYGVYSFALLFVPAWVAIVQAAAFELVYIGLSVLVGLDAQQRRRAGAIAGGAVVVSILYNSAAGLFHRRPEVLGVLPWWGDMLLSIAHGLPLALVAYFVADLLLHRGVHSAKDAAHLSALLRTEPAPAHAPARTDAPAVREVSAPMPAPPAPVPALLENDAPVLLAPPAPSAHACKKCGASVASAQAVAASARWGCATCKERAK